MNRTTIETRVAKILVEHLGVAESEIRPEVRLQPVESEGLSRRRHIHGEDLDADSLDVVELVMALEEEFSVEIADDEAERIVTVKDAVDMIERKVEEQGE